MIILLWYRCCHRQKQLDATVNDREFIKIRDGSVANNLQRGAATYWPTTNEQTYCVSNSGCLTAENGSIPVSTNIHDGCTYSDYGSGAGTLPHCAMHRYGGGCVAVCPNVVEHMAPAASSTLQRRSHSPSHHYHYAQLPDPRDAPYAATSSVISSDNNEALPTFCNHSRRAEVSIL